MTTKNPEYGFRWCPGCGDFGVRRALELAMAQRVQRTGEPIEQTVVVAGIGCSGNTVHLLEGPQPFGFHGIHGRTLPVAFGVKMARPDLNVLVVAGDGDFLSIGMEHIVPQVQRSLNVAALVLDNRIYGLTKGQSSPTTAPDVVTTTTPYGKLEKPLKPLELYLALGVPFVASGFSGNPKGLARLTSEAMDYPGFAIVHVQSPCTTYNDTYELLKGSRRKGIEPLAWDIPADHDPTDREAAYGIVRSGGIPLGIVYRQEDSKPLERRAEEAWAKVKPRDVEELLDAFALQVS